ncbi:hypothetical protein Godav_006391 [Gossypium davidsonii]|uniref:Uncharacterized protein n=1 Tax=Gossypium davidsonii TaxID=34287 RepID=A0A7J8S3K4_GOSDV|nr:hypothetical protein [Gossypium davidsonii]
MVELHNVRTFKANTGFKAGYLNKLERMLEKSHKETSQFRHRSFLYYDQLTSIYKKKSSHWERCSTSY